MGRGDARRGKSAGTPFAAQHAVNAATAAKTMLWRRLDVPGHDACRLEVAERGAILLGTAVFRDASGPARLCYEVRTDAAGATQHAAFRGWVGERRVDATIVRSRHGDWTCNGTRAPGLADCADVDFGFTPATNILHLRRLDIAIGSAAEVPVAWIDAGGTTLQRLPQRYERRGAQLYWYESPTVSYAAMLELTPNGFVAHYPRLWRAET